MPAVSAIAKAPPNVTRRVARTMAAPPAFAPIAPKSARNKREAIETVITSMDGGVVARARQKGSFTKAPIGRAEGLINPSRFFADATKDGVANLPNIYLIVSG